MQPPVVHDVGSWDDVRQHLLDASTPEINVPADIVSAPSSIRRFKYADRFSYNPETSQVYRDDSATESLQVRVFDGHYKVQLDRYNPEYYPVRHLIEDVIEKESREIRTVLEETDEGTLRKLKERAKSTDSNYLLGFIKDALN